MTKGTSDRPRSLTSAVLERLRADILSTKLAARPEAAYRRARQAVFGEPRGGARSACRGWSPTGWCRPPTSAAFGSARSRSPISRTSPRPGSISRAWRCAARSSVATRRGWRRWKRPSPRSAPFPTVIPTIRRAHNEAWIVRHRIFHRALVNACGSQWLLGFRDVLHEQSERYRRLSIRRETGTIRGRRSRTRRDRRCRAQARRRCRSHSTCAAFHDHLAPCRTRGSQNLGGQRHHLNRSAQKLRQNSKQKTEETSS